MNCALIFVVTGMAWVPKFGDLPGALIEEGAFHGDEIAAETGSEWLALVSTEVGFVLRRVTIAVETVFDAVMDNDERKPTGKRVNISGLGESEHSVLLVREIGHLREGPVRTVFEGVMRMLPGFQNRLGGPAEYVEGRSRDWTTLIASGTMRDPAQYCCASEDYRLAIQTMMWGVGDSHKSTVQVLVSVEDGTWPKDADDKLPEVRWIGDLDRDGVWDYLIDTGSHYNVTQLTLYLSSAAKEGAIVAPVAVFRRVGC